MPSDGPGPTDGPGGERRRRGSWAPGGGPVTVLHVDGDREYVERTADHLERESDRLTVLTATTAEAGLSTFEPEAVDCVVADHRLPDSDGLTLLDRLRERDPGVPFVVLTGEDDETVASEVVSRAAADYVPKGATTARYAVLANRIEGTVDRRRARRAYREVFERATVGIVLHDTETGAIEAVNPRMSEILGWEPAELLSMDVTEFSADEAPYTEADAAEHIRRAIEEGPQTFEWPGRTKAGDPVPVEISLRHTRIGGRDRVLATVRDISERKEREARLERENERLQEFASVVSHDLRNPLNVAQGYLQRLREECDSDAVDSLEGAIDRMTTITEDGLTLARQGEVVRDAEPVPLAEQVPEWAALVETGDLDVEVEDPPVVRGDPDRLRQAFENLVRNTIEHADGATTVTVGSVPGGFHVSDDGPGFPTVEDGGADVPQGESSLDLRSDGEDRGDSVFDAGHTSARDGSGLGLAIVRRIAEAHGWSVVATESDDGGARVEFRDVDAA